MQSIIWQAMWLQNSSSATRSQLIKQPRERTACLCVLKEMMISKVDVDIGDYDVAESSELIDQGGLKTEVREG